MRILEAIPSPGTHLGQGESGLSGRRYGNDLTAIEREARRVIWTPGGYSSGMVNHTTTRIGSCNS